jgi:hypothetical protein
VGTVASSVPVPESTPVAESLCTSSPASPEPGVAEDDPQEQATIAMSADRVVLIDPQAALCASAFDTATV